MVPRTLRRRLSGVVLASLALLPTAAGALPLFDWDRPGRQPAVHEEAGGLLTWVGEVVTGLWEETGMIIDPDGQPRPSGTSEGDTGMMIDPNG
jgi:hypothetical protein